MKYLKIFENYQSDKEIDEICYKYGIKNYTIDNGIVNVNDSVNLGYKSLTKIPLKFGKVTGNFNCNNNKLNSLEGCPAEIEGNFVCYTNQLTSLKGGPILVGGNFNCSHTYLKSLEGAPKKINKNFDCSNNKLTSLKGGPDVIIHNYYVNTNKLVTLEYCPVKIGGNFNCYNNKLTNLDGFISEICDNFFYEDNPIYDIYQEVKGVDMELFLYMNIDTELDSPDILQQKIDYLKSTL